MIDICLVNMPYASIERPSIALGLLESYLTSAGISVKSFYSNLRFGEFIGPSQYNMIEISSNEDLLGEWTFGGVAFPDFHTDQDAYFSWFPKNGSYFKEILVEVRKLASQFIEEESDRILLESPKIVGCTSTFQQNVASLAILRRIKEKAPDTITVMGGANCEGIMGQTLVDSFPWLDFAVSGEADHLIVPFVKILIEHGKGADRAILPEGVLYSGSLAANTTKIGTKAVARAMVKSMDESNIPIYDSYFSALNESAYRNMISPGLLIETARGCWWGAKHHCTFCGLNGTGMEFRSKSFERVLDELEYQSSRYNIRKFEVVDNILEMKYMNTLMKSLAEEEEPYSIFYETKANLRRDQVFQLKDAGINWIQPGFESLDDDFLKIIDKGTTAIQNVQTLKWCRESGIRVSWNLLAGAPGEKNEWYEKMMEWLPLISHLQSPQGIIKIRYDRFSPYFDRSQDFGLNLSPMPSYRHVYPLDEQGLKNIAYFFEDSSTTHEHYFFGRFTYFEMEGQKAVKEHINTWAKDFWSGWPPMLVMTDSGTSISFIDTRNVATAQSHTIEGKTADVYRICSKALTFDSLISSLSEFWGEAAKPEEVKEILNFLVEHKLLIFLSERYFAIALEGAVPTLIDASDFPGGHINFSVSQPNMRMVSAELKLT